MVTEQEITNISSIVGFISWRFFIIFGLHSTFEVLSRVRAVGSSSLWLGEGQRFESVTRNYLIINLKDTIMKILTLQINKECFHDILNAKQDIEHRYISVSYTHLGFTRNMPIRKIKYSILIWEVAVTGLLHLKWDLTSMLPK